MKLDLHQVDAFASELFGGNPAGVVTNADGLTDEQMQKIAREMNLSETAFVLTPTTKDADIRLRYFTPTTEVDFCGHATIGTLFELARLKLYGLGKSGESKVTVETPASTLDMWSTVTGDNVTVSYNMPLPVMEPFRLQGEALAKALGIPAKALLPDATALVNTALNDIFIPIASPQVLGDLVFDFVHIRDQFATEKFVVFGFFAKGNDGLDVRGVATFVGVDEDPFTGRIQAGLVATAKACGVVANNQKEIVTRQGQFIGRPGEALVTIDAKTGITKVSASAKHVFSTVLDPDS